MAGVCSRWRMTAISTPQLWTVIVCDASKGHLARINTMLSRSGDCSLEVHVTLQSLECQPDTLLALHSCLNRMETGHYLTKQLVDFIIEGPSFQRLRNLLLATSTTSKDLFAIFKHCLGLEDVEIWLDDTGVVSVPSHGVVMLKLHRLCMASYTDPTIFLDLLTAPNLLEFKESRGYANYGWSLSPLATFFRRSKATLRKFGVPFIVTTPEEMRATFETIPRLVELRLEENDMDLVHVYECLTIQADHAALLPELKMLTIVDDIFHEDLHEMILSRAQEYPLKKITLSFHYPMCELKHGPLVNLWHDTKRIGYDLEVRDRRGCVVNIDENGDYAV